MSLLAYNEKKKKNTNGLCYRELKGFKLYSELLKWQLSFSEVEQLVKHIVKEFAMPGAATEAQCRGDDWKAHSMYFICNSLLFLVFENYISRADAGGVLRVLKCWAYSFIGAGMWNYACECLEVLVVWKYELPEELCRALEQAWFMNRWGKPGQFIPMDLYLEHMNFWVKVHSLPPPLYQD